MLKQPFFSIILPVYNVEKYIAKCLDSILNQSFEDFEVIIIDDCGNDSSIDIATQYASKDARFKILKNSQNKGTFHTRLEGMRQARGEYLLFVDSDDFITSNACKEIYKLIKNYKTYQKDDISWGGGQQQTPDIICFGMEFYPKEKSSFMPVKPITGFSANDNAWNQLIKINGWNMCNKAFKREVVVQTLQFMDSLPPIPRLSMAEDCLQTFLLAIFAKEGILLNKTLYRYRRNNTTSITKTTSQTQITQSLKDYQSIIDFTDKIPNLNPTLKYNKKLLKRIMCIEIHMFKAGARNGHRLINLTIAHAKSFRYDPSHRPIIQVILLSYHLFRGGVKKILRILFSFFGFSKKC